MTTPTMTVTTTAPSPAAPAVVAPAATVAPAAPVAPVAAPAAPIATNIDDPAAAAPVAASVAAPAPPAADGKAVPVSYEPTGDAGLDMALGFLGKLGIGPADAAMQAAERGDFAMLKAQLALMGDKAQGWEQVVALGEQSYKGVQAKAQAEAKQTQDAILSVFGSDAAAAAAEWGKVRAWAADNAEPQERTAVNAALAAGGIAAKAMAAYLAGLYRAHPSAVIEPAIVSKVGGSPDFNAGALSPEQYKAELSKLRAAKGQAMDGSPDYKVLQQRRMAWRSAR